MEILHNIDTLIAFTLGIDGKSESEICGASTSKSYDISNNNKQERDRIADNSDSNLSSLVNGYVCNIINILQSRINTIPGTVKPFPSSFKSCTVGDNIDYRDHCEATFGKFFAVKIEDAARDSNHAFVHFIENTSKRRQLISFSREKFVFYRVNSVTKREISSDLKNLKINDSVCINPTMRKVHSGWKMGSVVTIESNQVKISYSYRNETYFYWTHPDFSNEICSLQKYRFVIKHNNIINLIKLYYSKEENLKQLRNDKQFIEKFKYISEPDITDFLICGKIRNTSMNVNIFINCNIIKYIRLYCMVYPIIIFAAANDN
eukprot:2339_1